MDIPSVLYMFFIEPVPPLFLLSELLLLIMFLPPPRALLMYFLSLPTLKYTHLSTCPKFLSSCQGKGVLLSCNL